MLISNDPQNWQLRVTVMTLADEVSQSGPGYGRDKLSVAATGATEHLELSKSDVKSTTLQYISFQSEAQYVGYVQFKVLNHFEYVADSSSNFLLYIVSIFQICGHILPAVSSKDSFRMSLFTSVVLIE
jgi:hypothetical protein